MLCQAQAQGQASRARAAARVRPVQGGPGPHEAAEGARARGALPRAQGARGVGTHRAYQQAVRGQARRAQRAQYPAQQPAEEEGRLQQVLLSPFYSRL